MHLVSFAAGTLLGAATLDLLPEAALLISPFELLLFTFLGGLLFFVLERALIWHHHHDHRGREPCAYTYLILFGDTVHNFIDGIAIAASFLAAFPLGVITTFAVALHEIPQEIGDFSVMLYGGFSRARTLIYNLISAAAALAGAVIAYFSLSAIHGIAPLLLTITAGMFIYIAVVDLLPEVGRYVHRAKIRLTLFLIICATGFFTVWMVSKLLGA